MIDFEDREPAPSLSWGERIFGFLIAVLSIYGIAASLWSLLH